VHNYTGDNDSDDEISDEEAAQYVISRSPKGKLGEFLDLAPSGGDVVVDADAFLEDDDNEVDEAALREVIAATAAATITTSSASSSGDSAQWPCEACTFVNKPSFLCCEVCATQRS
jgi:hypothetical protein